MSCTADLTSDAIKKSGISKTSREKGLKLIKQMIQAHGGLKNWQSTGSVRVTIRDYWPSWLMRTLGMPWEFSGQKVQLDWAQGTDNSRLTFLEGKAKGNIWGIQNWSPYVKRHNNIEFEENNEIKFWLPTMQYFIEAPFRIREANIVGYMGEKVLKLHNKKVKYDLVFASWKTYKPQSDIDQYVLWINRETKLMEFIQYTVRDMMSFMTAALHYKNFTRVGGVWFAKKMTIVSNPGEDNITHDMHIEKISIKQKFTPNYLLPNPKVKTRK